MLESVNISIMSPRFPGLLLDCDFFFTGGPEHFLVTYFEEYKTVALLGWIVLHTIIPKIYWILRGSIL